MFGVGGSGLVIRNGDGGEGWLLAVGVAVVVVSVVAGSHGDSGINSSGGGMNKKIKCSGGISGES